MAAAVQDGAFAWLLCAASFLNAIMLGAFMASGMFYIMFKDALDATDSEVSLITAINASLLNLVGPFAGMLIERYGNRSIAMIGAALSTAGLAATAFSTQIYHLYISYGFIAGMGLGMVLTSSISILDLYFNKYRRTACALTVTGGGVGAIIIPPILKCLEEGYVWRGSILLMAAINAHTVVFSSLFRPFRGNSNNKAKLKENTNNKEQNSTIEIKLLSKEANIVTAQESKDFQHKIRRVFLLFKIIPFLCLCVYAFICTFPYSLVLTHFGSYVLTIGFSSEDVVKLYMTLGLASTIGRPLTGIIAQGTNANAAALIMVAVLLNGALTMVVPLMNQLWMLYVYAVMFQLLMGSFFVLGPVVIMEHVPSSQVATAYGLFQFVCVPGFLIGAPMSVWLYQWTKVYAHSFLLAGGLFILSGLAMAPAAYNIHKKRTQTLNV